MARARPDQAPARPPRAAEGVTDAEFDAIHARVNRQIEAAVRFAKASPYPDPEEAYTDFWI